MSELNKQYINECISLNINISKFVAKLLNTGRILFKEILSFVGKVKNQHVLNRHRDNMVMVKELLCFSDCI